MKNGYQQFKKLLVSSQNGLSKKDGSVYAYICTDYATRGISSSSILNIGSDLERDVNVAKMYGLGSIFMPSAIDCLKKPTDTAPRGLFRCLFGNIA